MEEHGPGNVIDLVREDDTIGMLAAFQTTHLSPDTPDSGGWTLVHHACERNSISCLYSMLQYSADLDINKPTTRDHLTPLYVAAAKGNSQCIELLEQYAEFTEQVLYLSQTITGDTPLHVAAANVVNVNSTLLKFTGALRDNWCDVGQTRRGY